MFLFKENTGEELEHIKWERKGQADAESKELSLAAFDGEKGMR